MKRIRYAFGVLNTDKDYKKDLEAKKKEAISRILKDAEKYIVTGIETFRPDKGVEYYTLRLTIDDSCGIGRVEHGVFLGPPQIGERAYKELSDGYEQEVPK